METSNFSKVSSKYENASLVQNAASDKLFELIDIKDSEDVLDLGCGTGHITSKIRSLTQGRVVGIDSAAGMIEEASRKYSSHGIEFENRSAGDLGFENEFDVIFCNSTFQWFKPPEPVLKSCFKALRSCGRIAIQAPACSMYSPNFIQAVEAVRRDPRTGDTFSHFVGPWFFCETPEEYASVFRNAGFEVKISRIDEITSLYTPEEVFGVFDSGAAAGYLNKNCYDITIDAEYISTFKEIVKKSFENQSNEDGKVELVFNRIYLLAVKP